MKQWWKDKMSQITSAFLRCNHPIKVTEILWGFPLWGKKPTEFSDNKGNHQNSRHCIIFHQQKMPSFVNRSPLFELNFVYTLKAWHSPRITPPTTNQKSNLWLFQAKEYILIKCELIYIRRISLWWSLLDCGIVSQRKLWNPNSWR